MSSETSTEGGARPESGFEIWHFYVLVSMVAATVAVMLSPNTHPAALLLLSAAVVAAGLVGLAAHRAMAGFVSRDDERPAARDGERDVLEREKALTLRSIKELEFDCAMGKISQQDFNDLAGRLRARAMMLMEELDRLPPPEAPAPAPEPAAGPPLTTATAACPSCATPNDRDARFCKQCGGRL